MPDRGHEFPAPPVWTPVAGQDVPPPPVPAPSFDCRSTLNGEIGATCAADAEHKVRDICRNFYGDTNFTVGMAAVLVDSFGRPGPNEFVVSFHAERPPGRRIPGG